MLLKRQCYRIEIGGLSAEGLPTSFSTQWPKLARSEPNSFPFPDEVISVTGEVHLWFEGVLCVPIMENVPVLRR